MNYGTLVVLCVAAAFAAGGAQTFPNFPYCQCNKSPSPYSIDQTVVFRGNNTYCFKLVVKPMPPTETRYCAVNADIKKIEMNVNKACDVFGNVVNATVNGVPTRAGPNFAAPDQGPVDARILRLTQLNLSRSDNGAVICIKLGKNQNNRGCTTLEELCAPPAGAAPGSCTFALFDSKQDCCPLTNINTPRSPPSPARPPSSPLPAPAPPTSPPCRSCGYLVVQPPKDALFPYVLTQSACLKYGNFMYTSIADAAAAYNVPIVPGSVNITCTSNYVKVCLAFASADAALDLSATIDGILPRWLDQITPSNVCPAYLTSHTISARIGGDGNPESPPPSCLTGEANLACTNKRVDFPKCICNTSQAATPFAVTPYLSKSVGRPISGPYKPGLGNTTSLFCFTLAIVTPQFPTDKCANATTLLKAEIWGNDIVTQRRKIVSIGIQPAGAANMTYISPTWSTVGDQTLKATPLNWSIAQANGGKICMELSDLTTLGTFCNTDQNTCWMNLFSPDKDCCPLYAASL